MVISFVGCGKKNGSNESGVKKGELPYGFVWGQKSETIYETLKSEVGEEKIRIAEYDGSNTEISLKDATFLEKNCEEFYFGLKNGSLERVHAGYTFEKSEEAQNFYDEIANMYSKIGEGHEAVDGNGTMNYTLEINDTRYNVCLVKDRNQVGINLSEIDK